MKKNILLIILTLLLFTADAQAQDGFYIDEPNFYAKLESGANFLQNIPIGETKSSFQPGYIIGGSLGYYWRYGLRLEAEYAFRRNAIRKIHFFGQGSSKHGHFEASSGMLNLLCDLPLSFWGCSYWDIEPYIGAGIGYDFQHLHSSNSLVIFSQKWNHFSWQVMTGLIYPIFCNTELTLEYKFHQGGSHFNNHTLGVGFIYKFGLNIIK